MSQHNSADLIDFVAIETYVASAAFRRHGGALARKIGQTQARWQVLRIASAGSLTVAQIARRLGVSRQNIQRIADALVRDGLAEFRENRDHKSSPHLHVNERGQAVLLQLSKGGMGYRKALAAELKDVDLDVLLRSLRLLSAALSKMDSYREKTPAGNARGKVKTPLVSAA